jgi:hypothetical protein
VIGCLLAVSPLGTIWRPALWALVLALVAGAATIALAARAASTASFPGVHARIVVLKLRGLTALLILLQPAARLLGRLSFGLSPWRGWTALTRSVPWPRHIAVWSERWQTTDAWLMSVERSLRDGGGVRAGGVFDDWDLEVRIGMWAAARLRMAIEEHGAGRQMVRFRIWPKMTGVVPGLASVLAALSAAALWDGAPVASALFAVASAVVCWTMVRGCSVAMARLLQALPDNGPCAREGT